jgi:hypothetical protein
MMSGISTSGAAAGMAGGLVVEEAFGTECIICTVLMLHVLVAERH